MASLKFTEGIAIVTCGSKLRVFSFSDTEFTMVKEDLNSQEYKGHQTEEEQPEQAISVSKTIDPNQRQPCGEILCCSVSSSGDYVTCCDDRKYLYLWKTYPWTLLSQRVIQKRCTSVSFSSSEEHLFMADKFGDVYQFAVKIVDEPGFLLLGHVSMVLDLAVTPDDKFIITCDRDEKIRVSCLPNAYSIHGYCLGHTQFVSRFQVFPGREKLLVSAGGDSSLKLWDYCDCRLLASTLINYESRIKKPEEYFTVTHLTCSERGYVAVCLLGEKVCLIYKLLEDSSGITLNEVSKVDCDAQVLCMTFDHNGFLWIIQGSPTKTVQAFQLSELNEECKVTRVTTFPEVWKSSLFKSLNQDWEFFKDSVNAERPFTFLHKKSFDNLKDYMERKQHRIADEEIRREKYTARLARQAQRKRMKVETTDEVKGQT